MLFEMKGSSIIIFVEMRQTAELVNIDTT